jgi:GNAT superfamily N-acetyltransferase
MEIRPALPEDATMIAELLAALGYPSPPEEVRRRLITLDDSDCVLLTEGGLIALHRIPRLAEGDPLARITALVVAPERRAKGVGRELLRAAEDVARRWGCHMLEVSSSRRPERDAAHSFYPSEGFEDAGAHSMRYWKRLDSSSVPRAGRSERETR